MIAVWIVLLTGIFLIALSAVRHLKEIPDAEL